MLLKYIIYSLYLFLISLSVILFMLVFVLSFTQREVNQETFGITIVSLSLFLVIVMLIREAYAGTIVRENLIENLLIGHLVLFYIYVKNQFKKTLLTMAIMIVIFFIILVFICISFVYTSSSTLESLNLNIFSAISIYISCLTTVWIMNKEAEDNLLIACRRFIIWTSIAIITIILNLIIIANSIKLDGSFGFEQLVIVVAGVVSIPSIIDSWKTLLKEFKKVGNDDIQLYLDNIYLIYSYPTYKYYLLKNTIGVSKHTQQQK